MFTNPARRGLPRRQFAYLLFFERLLVVHKAMNMNTWRMRMARNLLATVAVAVIPLSLYWVAYVEFTGVIVSTAADQPGYCEQDTFSLVAPVYFVVLDTPLSAFLLGLFIMPLLEHIQQMHKIDAGSGNTKKFYAVALRNLVLSTVMICGSLTLALLMIITLTSSFHPDGTRTLPVLSSWRTFWGLSDTLLTVVCCHLLSTFALSYGRTR